VFGHPDPERGGTMHTKVVYHAAKALARTGCGVLRINFRGAGASAGGFAGVGGAMEDFRSALDFMSYRFAGSRLWTAGMSFGSWVSMTAGAQDPRVSTLIGIACPIAKYDWQQVLLSTKPKFFIHGERDEVAPLRDIREFYARAAEPKELVVIDGADHLFDGKVGDVADAVEDLLGDWSG
jgi:alpha/beta superfamily hydrolase